MTRSIRILLVALGLALGLAIPTAAAYAGEDENHHRGASAGAACTPRWKVGDTATINSPNGPQKYRCEQRPGDPCPVWHWVYDPDVPKGQKKPRGCPECPSSSPPVSSAPPSSVPPSSPPVSSSSSPPATSTSSTPPASGPPASPSVSEPPRNQLPVTGTKPWQLALGALVLLLVGFGLVRVARRSRRTA